MSGMVWTILTAVMLVGAIYLVSVEVKKSNDYNDNLKKEEEKKKAEEESRRKNN